MYVSVRLGRLLVCVVLLACVFAAGADAASRGPCIAGKSRPLCYHWQGRVTFVADGDTIDVNVRGDGTSRSIRVRMTGINAMEQTVYSHDPSKRRGHCHSLRATARLEELVPIGKLVRLSAQDRASRSGGRTRRSVSVKIGGTWRDVGQFLVDEGHVLWLANKKEWARNAAYSRGTQLAARRGENLWDTDFCGSGPLDGAPLRMWVNWNADGSDRPRYRGEWARIKNTGATDVPIGGWWFRDSHLRRYRFPSGAVIPAHRAITVIVGRRPAGDANRRTRFYWRQGNSVFDNAGSRALGDGGYLFDRQGDLRVWMMYPCHVACRDPLKGKIAVTAHPSRPEKVFLRNIGGVLADLEGYVVENDPYVYSLPGGTFLRPGETLRLIVKGSPRNNTRLVRYWGKSKYILNDDGDRVLLRTQTNVRLACDAWGRRRC